MTLSVSTYINQISNLFLNMQITNQSNEIFPLDEGFRKTVDLILSVKDTPRKIVILGNGGSAAIASHIQTDLVNAVQVRAMVFTEPSLLTCLSNDYGYEEAFQRQGSIWFDEQDVVIAISSSGRSKNIINTVRLAHDKGCRIITLSGFKPNNPLRMLGEINYYIAAENYGLVEASHAVIAHCLTDFSLPQKGS